MNGGYPLVMTTTAIESGPVEIVSFPIKHEGYFHGYENVYQRVTSSTNGPLVFIDDYSLSIISSTHVINDLLSLDHWLKKSVFTHQKGASGSFRPTARMLWISQWTTPHQPSQSLDFARMGMWTVDKKRQMSKSSKC